MSAMHDWTLLFVNKNWGDKSLEIGFLNENSEKVSIIAKNATDLRVTQREEWGRSFSVNRVFRLKKADSVKMFIEIQSGDLLIVEADSFYMPIDQDLISCLEEDVALQLKEVLVKISEF